MTTLTMRMVKGEQATGETSSREVGFCVEHPTRAGRSEAGEGGTRRRLDNANRAQADPVPG
jgi:hypothetical protein